MAKKETGNPTAREQRVLDEWEDCEGNITECAKRAGVDRRSAQRILQKFGLNLPIFEGTNTGIKPIIRSLPPPGQIKRYIISCAQSNTPVYAPLLRNLEAYAEWLSKDGPVEILISRFSYNKRTYGANAVKPGTKKPSDNHEMWFDEQISPYVCDERLQLAPGMVFNGDWEMYPTQTHPLAGLDTVNGRKSSIFPHVKMEMRSIATLPSEPVKLQYSTGAVTKLNYIKKRAGFIAEHYHTFGALIVEVQSDGNWWVRQLHSDGNGNLQDWTRRVTKGVVSDGHRIEGMQPGDVHASEIDPEVKRIIWGENGTGGLIDELKPKYQFYHDLFSMRSRSHHEMHDFYRMYEKHMRSEESVWEEIETTARFVREADRPFCKAVVVRSNHDIHLEKWLATADFREDYMNARFFLEATLAKIEAMERADNRFMVLEWALRKANIPASVKFLVEDEPFVTCAKYGGGIENGMHGHLGPRGARGSPQNISKIGRRSNIGHFHAAGIYHGTYVAGTCSVLKLPYTKGPSDWTHSLVITYPNGKRSVITIWNGQPCARAA